MFYNQTIMSKFIIFSAPSGSGKSTIINHLLKQGFNLEFSISATSRKPRGNEQNGKEYYFLSTEEFRQRIANNEFLEYEEVYEGSFYGTLRSEIERISAKNHIPIFDVDVKGGLNIKKQYPNDAMTVFIQPPSIEELRSRLEKRSTDAPEVIEKRLAKAAYELSFADQFDKIIINDNLEEAKANAEKIIRSFLEL
jgi:guanylate kinase